MVNYAKSVVNAKVKNNYSGGKQVTSGTKKKKESGNLSLHGRERKHFDKVARILFLYSREKVCDSFLRKRQDGCTEEAGKIHKTREAVKGDILPRVACIMHEEFSLESH